MERLILENRRIAEVINFIESYGNTILTMEINGLRKLLKTELGVISMTKIKNYYDNCYDLKFNNFIWVSFYGTGSSIFTEYGLANVKKVLITDYNSNLLRIEIAREELKAC